MNYSPKTLQSSIDDLYDYCQDYFKDDPRNGLLRRDFWKIQSESLFYEVLCFMPLHIHEELIEEDTTPIGYKLAYPILHLEDDYNFNGWGAIENASQEMLDRAIKAYAYIGMAEESRALERVVSIYNEQGYDEESMIQAYRSEPNPYIDDDVKAGKMGSWFFNHRSLFAMDHERP